MKVAHVQDGRSAVLLVFLFGSGGKTIHPWHSEFVVVLIAEQSVAAGEGEERAAGACILNMIWHSRECIGECINEKGRARCGHSCSSEMLIEGKNTD